MKISPLGSIICLLILLPSLFFSYRIDGVLKQASAKSVSLSSFPDKLGPWTGGETSRLDARSQDILKLDEYLRREYRTPDGKAVFVYV